MNTIGSGPGHLHTTHRGSWRARVRAGGRLLSTTPVARLPSTATDGALAAAPPEVTPDTVRVARIVHGTDAEGPGRRTAVWVQGCTIRCPGCFNPHLWTSGGPITDTGRFATETLHRAVATGAQGITLLGGEPFEQAAPIARVAEHFRAAGCR